MKPRIVGLETEYGFMPMADNMRQRYATLVCVLPQRFLDNGGKVYVNAECSGKHAMEAKTATHPEYATPECLSLTLEDIVAHDKAGECILLQKLPMFQLFKTNSDFYGHRCGCHENYSLSPSENKKEVDIEYELQPFFVARQVFTGSGRIRKGVYKISQRNSFFDGYACVVLDREDDFNRSYREGNCRAQVLCGDSNMSEIATYLKVGMTCLVLDLLEDGELPEVAIDKIIGTDKCFRSISSDVSCRVKVPVTFNGKSCRMSAIEILDEYLEKAMRYAGKDAVTDDVLGKWIYGLEILKEDPMELRWADWVLKKRLLDEFMMAENLPLHHSWVKSVALEYHNINREDSETRQKGLFYALQDAGKIERVVRDQKILDAMLNPPINTRAWRRADLIKKYGAEVNHLSTIWDSLVCDNPCRKISLNDPFEFR